LTGDGKSFVHDERNRLTSAAGVAYTWSARGNRTGVTGQAAFTFDALDRQTGVGGATYTYDSLDRVIGRTVSGVTKWFGYAGFETDPVQDGTSSWSRSPAGSVLGQTRAGTSVLVGTERHGDVAWTLNPTTGTIADSTVSDPFGKALSVTGAPGQIGFQGDWTDPLTGLVWMAARWYDTQTGTFTSRDTYPGQIGAALTLNRYLYASGSPLLYTDPTGRYSIGEVSWVVSELVEAKPNQDNGQSVTQAGWSSNDNFFSWGSRENKVTGSDNWIDGNENTVSGDGNLVHGSENRVFGDFNLVVGAENKVHGDVNVVVGSDNRIGRSSDPVAFSFVVGDDNRVFSSFDTVLGSDNIVWGGFTTIVGNKKGSFGDFQNQESKDSSKLLTEVSVTLQRLSSTEANRLIFNLNTRSLVYGSAVERSKKADDPCNSDIVSRVMCVLTDSEPLPKGVSIGMVPTSGGKGKPLPKAVVPKPGVTNIGSNVTRGGVERNNPADWRRTRNLWDKVGLEDILSEANRKSIAIGRSPVVDTAWVKHFPGDAALVGQKISPHHIGGGPITVPLPKSRHLEAHMPGGFRYNPGGPGATG
jgi:RHS repeat-associated protein